jgi:hypothetical protein
MLSHLVEKENHYKNISKNCEKEQDKYPNNKLNKIELKDKNNSLIENIVSEINCINKLEVRNNEKSDKNQMNILQLSKKENTDSNEELRNLIKTIDLKKLVPWNHNTDNNPQKNIGEKKEEIKHFSLKENVSEAFKRSSINLQNPKFEDKNKESFIKDRTNIISEESSKENLENEDVIRNFNNNLKTNTENQLNPSNEMTKKTRFKSKIINFTLKILNRSSTN